MSPTSFPVLSPPIPAQAGTQATLEVAVTSAPAATVAWIPACAGMSGV